MRRTWLVGVLAAALLCAIPGGAQAAPAPAEFRDFELPSKLIDSSTPGGDLPGDQTVPKVNVLLPEGYDRDRRYPVLWLLHGANGGTDTWLGSIAELLDGLHAIVVMPDGGLFGMYMNWWNDGARGDPAWTTYHLKLFRREIERRYPIRPGRRWHAIGGISMGGQGTLRYAAMLPGYFGSAAAFSPALPDTQTSETEGAISLLATAAAPGASYRAIFGSATAAYAEGNSPMALAPNYGHTRLYLTSGDGINCPQDPVNTSSFALDVVTEARIDAQRIPFAAAAAAAGADVTDVQTCGVHTFGVWDRAIPAAREWGFFRPVTERPRNWVYRTVATNGEMWGLHFRFDGPPSEVATFERSGRELSASGSGKVQIRGSGGCRLRVRLPFVRLLPPACIDPSS